MREFIKFTGYILAFLLLFLPFAVHASCKCRPPGPQGIPGPVGPPGPSPFTPDVGSVLSFTNAFQAGGVLPAGSIIIPFVSEPNGVIIEGTPIVADGILTDFFFSPIVVGDPVFGVYLSGVQVTLSGDFTPGLINLTAKVVSDRAGPSPAKITLVGENDSLTPVFMYPLTAGNQYQVAAEFTYGPGNVP